MFSFPRTWPLVIHGLHSAYWPSSYLVFYFAILSPDSSGRVKSPKTGTGLVHFRFPWEILISVCWLGHRDFQTCKAHFSLVTPTLELFASSNNCLHPWEKRKKDNTWLVVFCGRLEKVPFKQNVELLPQIKFEYYNGRSPSISAFCNYHRN